MTSKKYLFYDDIVRGAGLGHTLCTYAHGLELSKTLNLEFMPCRITAGHGLKKLEDFLGLKDFQNDRAAVEKSHPDQVRRAMYTKGNHASLGLKHWSQDTRAFFRQSYKGALGPLENHLDSSATSIAVSIRRGDILNLEKENGFRKRLRPDQFYTHVVNEILKLHQPREYLLYIYSDGAPDGNHYVDEKGKPRDVLELFKKHKDQVRAHLGQRDHIRTFTCLQNCVNADIFIGSISGFSDFISILRKGRNTYLPHPNHPLNFIKYD